MKIFISGPMTGHKNYNRKKFNRIARKLSKKHIVINPAMLPDGLKHEEYLEISKVMIDVCDGVYFLKGYAKSKGAVIEWQYARRNDKRIFFEGECESWMF